jgi:hypothetical protein
MANGEWNSLSVIHNLLRAHSATEIQEHEGFVADSPGIVTSRHGCDIARREIHLTSVCDNHVR